MGTEISDSDTERLRQRRRAPAARAGAMAVLLATAGCAGQSATESGFLPNYAQMTPTKGHVDDLIYVNPGYQSGQYHAAIIDPVMWRPVSDAPKLDDAHAARLTKEFGDQLGQTLGGKLRIVDAASCGPCTGVLHIRGAITNVRRSKWYYNAIPMVLGMGAAAAGAVMPPIPPPAPGGASEELAAVDAATGETEVAISTFNNGMPWNVKGQFYAYAHAERAFRLAAELMAEQLWANGQTALAQR